MSNTPRVEELLRTFHRQPLHKTLVVLLVELAETLENENTRLKTAIREHKATFPDEVCEGERTLWAVLEDHVDAFPAESEISGLSASLEERKKGACRPPAESVVVLSSVLELDGSFQPYLVVDHQSFQFARHTDTKEESDWYCEQMRLALERAGTRAMLGNPAVALVKELLDMMVACNPQHPDMQGFEECPEGHEFSCGRCELMHRARKWIEQNTDT